jgi:hypothetical protein
MALLGALVGIAALSVGRFATGVLIAASIVIVLGAANLGKIVYLRAPVTFTDIYTLPALLQVAGHYLSPLLVGAGGLAIAAWTAVLVFSWRHSRSISVRKSGAVVLSAATVMGATFSLERNDICETRFPSQGWPTLELYQQGMLRSFARSVQRVWTRPKPVEPRLALNAGRPPASIARVAGSVKPHVIVLQLESYLDYTSLFGIPRAACMNELLGSPSATMLSPVYGGNSQAMDAEVLSGYPHAMLRGEWLYFLLNRPLPTSLPNSFNEAGYRTASVVTTPGNMFNIAAAYRHLGFRSRVFLGDDKAWSQRVAHFRGYPTDQALFDALQDWLRGDGSGSSPAFAFGVSYATHGPFERRADAGYLTARRQMDEHFGAASVGDAERNVLADMFYAMRELEAQLCAFIVELRKIARPTVIAVYADHKPYLGAGQGFGAYARSQGFDLARFAERGAYQVPLWIWRSDRGTLRGIPTEFAAVSLGGLLCQLAGVECSPIFEFNLWHKDDLDRFHRCSYHPVRTRCSVAHDSLYGDLYERVY